jgi:pre-mRNA-processing factor 40
MSAVVFYFDECKTQSSRHLDKQLKKRIDSLRSVIKRLDPPFTIDTKYEDIVPLLSNKVEYERLTPEARLTAFKKSIARLKVFYVKF